MDITYLGHSSFRIRTKTATIVTDPFDPKMVGLKYAPGEGNIVTVSHQHADHNQANLVNAPAGGEKRVIDGPGEYEISGVTITGIASFHDDKEGTLRGKNTIYVYEAEGLRLAHLGDLGHTLDEKKVEEIGDIDILMIPVGGEYTIGPKEAASVVSEIGPYFVIPMHYQTQGLAPATFEKLSPVEDFLKEASLPVERLPKFQIKKEDILEDQNPKIIILEKR